MAKPSKAAIENAFSLALAEARRGVRLGHGGPFGAVIIRGAELVASAHNTVLKDHDPTAHAEVNAIRLAARRLGQPHLKGCWLIATSEPCPLCLAAAHWARLSAVRYAVGRKEADRLGFDDCRIAAQLRGRGGRRSVCRRQDGFRESVKAVMKDWKRNHGKLY
jgi:guanine deaminase